MKQLLIAEIKTHSPFGFTSSKSWEELFAVANKYGDMLSVHTDERWGGSFEILRRARQMTNKPILAKGIHATDEEIERAVALGADKVLVVGRVPQAHRDKCLIEPYTLSELLSLPTGTQVVWNSRDLENGKPKSITFTEACESFSGWMCQASNIKTMADVHPSANAILIGENLVEFIESLGKSSDSCL